MRDRLIELIGEVYARCKDTKHCSLCEFVKEGGTCFQHLMASHLLANGAIVPPCKRGDKIYCIRKDKYGTPFVKELEVRSVTVYGNDRFTVYTTKDDVWGRTAFATESEAEKALKERSNENDE